jgi:probable HAF family extracellular repeat protein
MPISMPGVANTCAEAINDEGVIVGGVSNDGYVTGSGFVDDDGIFTALNFPGATLTTAIGINDLGQIVGSYVDANGNEQAFLATPTSSPEPATWAMILIGLAGLAGGRLRRGVQRGTVESSCNKPDSATALIRRSNAVCVR